MEIPKSFDVLHGAYHDLRWKEPDQIECPYWEFMSIFGK